MRTTRSAMSASGMPTSDMPALPWYKQFWPWFLIALPSAVVIGCIISIDIAFKYADAPVQGDYEKHGLTVLHKAKDQK